MSPYEVHGERCLKYVSNGTIRSCPQTCLNILPSVSSRPCMDVIVDLFAPLNHSSKVSMQPTLPQQYHLSLWPNIWLVVGMYRNRMTWYSISLLHLQPIQASNCWWLSWRNNIWWFICCLHLYADQQIHRRMYTTRIWLSMIELTEHHLMIHILLAPIRRSTDPQAYVHNPNISQIYSSLTTVYSSFSMGAIQICRRSSVPEGFMVAKQWLVRVRFPTQQASQHPKR